jgi:hypothetical protein
MKKDLLLEFTASYFYKKGYEDSKPDLLNNYNDLERKSISESIKDCLKAYKEEIKEQRKSNPHHHSNRLD